ncbi:preprotein translocase sec sec61-beta subunit [Diplodia corticola]|uniref:Preprotein translocase sec sec61-beta subunit n=1 Tax=Diplodia corticola TaxID=236234 RepID=A0A1J9RRC5_9PEZI|nr:preprotein translocase sec sec61-beta subunit [Diplodia corticola]OJD35083.1 preprotein translocase sec sec61-beta subunit [Diplodia corticola]
MLSSRLALESMGEDELRPHLGARWIRAAPSPSPLSKLAGERFTPTPNSADHIRSPLLACRASPSPVNSPPATGSTTARPSSPKPPGGPAVAIRRKAAADRADKVANARPSSTRAAGAGGSSSTMLRLYTDESPGLKVDPVVVLVLSVGFIISVVALHVIAKITKKFSA